MMAQAQVLLVDVFLWLRVSHPGSEMIRLWFWCQVDLNNHLFQFYLGTCGLWTRVSFSGHKIHFDKFLSLFKDDIWHQLLKVQK